MWARSRDGWSHEADQVTDEYMMGDHVTDDHVTDDHVINDHVTDKTALYLDLVALSFNGFLFGLGSGVGTS